MTVLAIAKVGAPVLRRKTRELSLEELASEKMQTLLDDMIETMHAANGAGLAANQVFADVRACVIEVRAPNPRYPYKPAIPLTVLVNPKVTPLGEDTIEVYEGCLSVDDLRGVVQRHARVRVDYLDRKGNPHTLETAGISAGTYQHEVDHLDGMLFLDRVEDPRSLTTWASFHEHYEADFVVRAEDIVRRYGS